MYMGRANQQLNTPTGGSSRSLWRTLPRIFLHIASFVALYGQDRHYEVVSHEKGVEALDEKTKKGKDTSRVELMPLMSVDPRSGTNSRPFKRMAPTSRGFYLHTHPLKPAQGR